MTSTYCINSIGEHEVVNSVTIEVKLLTSWICEQDLNQNIQQVFLKIQEVSSHFLGQDEMFCYIMQWLFIASIWQCFTAYKQNIGKRAYMQKFSNRTCADKKPKQKKITVESKIFAL